LPISLCMMCYNAVRRLKEKFEELRGKVTLRKMKKKGQIKLPFLWNSLMSI